MYRSVSWSRVSDDYSPKKSSGQKLSSSASLDSSELPLYDSTEKDKRDKFSENAVHLIPFVLLFCAFVLWFFSHPVDVEVGFKAADSIAAKIEGLTIEGDIDTDSDGTQTSVLPVENVQEEGMAQTRENKHHRKGPKRVHTRSFY